MSYDSTNNQTAPILDDLGEIDAATQFRRNWEQNGFDQMSPSQQQEFLDQGERNLEFVERRVADQLHVHIHQEEMLSMLKVLGATDTDLMTMPSVFNELGRSPEAEARDYREICSYRSAIIPEQDPNKEHRVMNKDMQQHQIPFKPFVLPSTDIAMFQNRKRLFPPVRDWFHDNTGVQALNKFIGHMVHAWGRGHIDPGGILTEMKNCRRTGRTHQNRYNVEYYIIRTTKNEANSRTASPSPEGVHQDG